MSINNTISNDLFLKLKGHFPQVRLGNEQGMSTVDPNEAVFFDFDFAPNGEKIVGYVGRLAAEKQVHRMAELFGTPNTRFVIVGDGPERKRLETEFSNVAGRPMHLINLACAQQPKCLYLQRYKGKTEMGWCIGWALLFLDHLTDHPEFASMSKQAKTKHVARLYRWIDKQLSTRKSNAFIEKYYIKLLGL
jgi:glycosyltransferase involved in cell wall biosynthesis